MQFLQLISIFLSAASISCMRFNKAWGLSPATVADNGGADVPLLIGNGQYQDPELAQSAESVERYLSDASPVCILEAPDYQETMEQFGLYYRTNRDNLARLSPFNFRKAYEDAIMSLDAPMKALLHYHHQIRENPRVKYGPADLQALHGDLLSTFRVVEDEFYKLQENFKYKDAAETHVLPEVMRKICGSACLDREVEAFDKEVVSFQLKINDMLMKLGQFMNLCKLKPCKHLPDAQPLNDLSYGRSA